MLALSWMYDRYIMTACEQSFDQIRQGHGDAVDFGRIGLGNNAETLRV